MDSRDAILVKLAVRECLQRLVNGRFGSLRSLADCDVGELEQTLGGLGGELVHPPLEAFDAVEVTDLGVIEERPRVRARLRMWTAGGPCEHFLGLEMDDDDYLPTAIKHLWLEQAGEGQGERTQEWQELGPTIWGSVTAISDRDRRGIRASIGMNADSLAAGLFDVMSNVSGGTLPDEEAERKVLELGEPLVRPPDEAFGDVEVMVLDDDPLGRPHLRSRFALWTAAGPSDLFLEERILGDGFPFRWRIEEMKLYRADEEPDDGPGRWERVGR